MEICISNDSTKRMAIIALQIRLMELPSKQHYSSFSPVWVVGVYKLDLQHFAAPTFVQAGGGSLVIMLII